MSVAVLIGAVLLAAPAVADTITLDTGATIEGDLARYEFGGDCQVSVTEGDLAGVIVIVPCHRVQSFVRTASGRPAAIGVFSPPAAVDEAAPVAAEPVVAEVALEPAPDVAPLAMPAIEAPVAERTPDEPIIPERWEPPATATNQPRPTPAMGEADEPARRSVSF